MENFQVLLACLSDLKILKEKESLTTDEILKLTLQGEKIPDIHFQMSLKNELYRKIAEGIIDYGRKVGDTEQNISKVLASIPVKHDPERRTPAEIL